MSSCIKKRAAYCCLKMDKTVTSIPKRDWLVWTTFSLKQCRQGRCLYQRQSQGNLKWSENLWEIQSFFDKFHFCPIATRYIGQRYKRNWFDSARLRWMNLSNLEVNSALTRTASFRHSPFSSLGISFAPSWLESSRSYKFWENCAH